MLLPKSSGRADIRVTNTQTHRTATRCTCAPRLNNKKEPCCLHVIRWQRPQQRILLPSFPPHQNNFIHIPCVCTANEVRNMNNALLLCMRFVELRFFFPPDLIILLHTLILSFLLPFFFPSLSSSLDVT